jgi:stage II sporulation protein D
MALGLALAGLVGPTWLSRPVRAEPRVRVLVLERDGPVGITPQDSPSREVAPGGRPGWLLLDGAPVRSPLRLGAASVRVADGVYRGGVTVHRLERGLAVVNEVPLEDYVAGTLHKEVYPTWEGEALRAQAIATRTYALYRMRRSRSPWHDVDATPGDQVYGGVSAETEAARRAVRDTDGLYLAWHGRPILAAFHSTAGGRTASAEEVWGRALPYLVSRRVPGEDLSPHSFWQLRVSPDELERILERQRLPVGRVRDARVVERTSSGRTRWVEVEGSRATQRLSGRDLREGLGVRRVKSTLFDVRPDHGSFVVLGSGYGHGVGMSQWGARALARQGVHYPEILARFYPGTTLEHLGGAPEFAAHGTGR